MKLPKHLTLHEFDDRLQLAETLANEIAHQLDREIQIRGSATMAVSGGNTPLQLFKMLSRAELSWTHITVTLVDERWVDPQNDRSNERLVKENLLVGRAGFARFVPFYLDGSDAESAETTIGTSIDQLPDPFDVVVLGMGADGHTASFFTGADNLTAVTNPMASTAVRAIRATNTGETRMTLTLPRLLSSRFLALHIEGKNKHKTLEQALQDGDANDMPIRHILRNKGTETNIFWAP